jgi:hypothetical protein
VATGPTGTRLADTVDMARPRQRQRPIWPSDDQVRDPEGNREFTEDGRKVTDSERVGGMTPDADPEPPAPHTGPRAPR